MWGRKKETEKETDLSPTARLLKEQHEKRSFLGRKKEAASSIGKAAHEVQVAGKFLSSIGRVLLWMWWNIGNPVINMFTVPIFVRMGKAYARAWLRFTHYKDEYGHEKTSMVKGTAMVAATVIAFFLAVNTFFLAIDTGLYFTTVEKNQRVWLSSAQEIIPDSGVFSMQGCEITSENEAGLSVCDPESSLYYRTGPSTFNNLWSIMSGHGIFFSDRIVAPIGADWSQCTATTYGVRFRLLVFLWDMYPTLLSASCERRMG